jgi:hypothetical protein
MAEKQQLCVQCKKNPRKKASNGKIRKRCQPCLTKGLTYWKQRKAREDAFGKKDTGDKKRYKKRVPVPAILMAGMVADLEQFINNIPTMSATDYLEERENLIKGIIVRGGKLNGSET